MNDVGISTREKKEGCARKYNQLTFRAFKIRTSIDHKRVAGETELEPMTTVEEKVIDAAIAADTVSFFVYHRKRLDCSP